MSDPHILILAAGQGKRMRSSMPKVLHPVLFRPMLHYVLDLAESVPHRSVSVVVGHGEADVRAACEAYSNVEFHTQKEQRGTAHAVLAARASLAGQQGTVLILSGDVILLTRGTIDGLLERHASAGAAATILTAELAVPKGYGRILFAKTGAVLGIREDADCSSEERSLCEVNAGVYCFEIPELLEALSKIGDENKQSEFYLTDAIALLASMGKKAVTYRLCDEGEMTGINDRVALSEVERSIQRRVNRKWMLDGVTIHSPDTVLIDPTSQIESDVTIEPNCVLIHSIVRGGSRLKAGSYVESSEIGRGCSVGPYAHLRPGSRLGDDVKIGNFVELKKSVMAKGSKASHLSYIGDAEVGENANLGCGFITCNYDGTSKHKTVIERDVFVGSDSQTVAPVRVGAGSYVASGSTVTEDVPPNSLVLSRGKQITKPGYAKKYRK